jgi:hypothetical protein
VKRRHIAVVALALDQVLGLVGTLDDSPGENTARERFRGFLRETVTSIGTVRDYVELCAKNKGPQYDFALQDLINHAGTLIGFDVEFGRYKGVANDIGHDGLWRRDDFSIVVEVKTTDAFTIRTDTLLGYVNRLISASKVSDWDHTMGLYVFARADAELKSLANSIIAEKRTHELRIATVDTIMSLAELVQDGHIAPDEALSLLKPGGVFISDTVQLLARIAAEPSALPENGGAQTPNPSLALRDGTEAYDARPVAETSIAPPSSITLLTSREKNASVSTWSASRLHLMTPVRDEEGTTAKETISSLLKAGWYVFADKTPGRKRIKPGDRICFYESGIGVIADAEIASVPQREPPPIRGLVKNLEKFAWSFRLDNPRFYFENAIAIDAELRNQLQAFENRDPSHSWSWFVQGTRIVTEHDFEVLTGRRK